MHLHIAGCFLETEGKFLILHRLPEKSEGGKWGIPAGKVEHGEREEEAVAREVLEETGIEVDPSALEHLPQITWDFGDKIVSFTPFRIRLAPPISVRINNNEHQSFKWVTGVECYAHENLMHGVQDLLERTGYIKSA